MRRIGKIPNQELADRLLDYLLTEGIRSKAEPDNADDSTELGLWINEEDKVPASREILAHFLEHPDDPKYQGHAKAAKSLRKEYLDQRVFARKNYREGRDIWGKSPSLAAKRIPLTMGMIAICVLVGLWTGFGSVNTDLLSYVSDEHRHDPDWEMTNPIDASVDIIGGQFWRIITPNFVHYGTLHLLFNMIWLHMLGGQVEMRKGRTKYILLVLILAVACSLIQVVVARYPFFGGMSGVVYGLFGYIWMKARYDPSDGFQISESTIRWMMVWFVICFLPILGVANGGHAGGLIAGAAMGYYSATTR